ncbi:carboxyl transferase domain-containing protein [Saccharomonospora iraqiensis]|uniref:carboxyl transferase domain-containing protein n=1 Tax=Saccharomonospora iraqiensis TaxID=52698 RepID=UPI00022E157A|nr:carboxyl transferase domain-containing protein [Saccharomonospora iraqiensis]
MSDTARGLLTTIADDVTELVPPGLSTPAAPDGPIGWRGYDLQRADAARRSGEEESIVCGTGRVGGVDTVLVAFEFAHLGGSIGERTGLRLQHAFAEARRRSAPVVSLVATGGSRMQEGMRALSQLHRIARALAAHRDAGLPHVAVVRDPTTGGGWATLASGADVTVAVPGAQAGFAGSRVRPPGEPHAYTTEGQYASGQLDRVVPPETLRELLHRWVPLLARPARGPAPPPGALGAAAPPATGWEAVSRARAAGRPHAEAYLDAYFAWRENLSGDRCGGVDDGVRCGIGRRAGGAVAYAAQCGTPTTPAGFRTAARLLRLADRLGLPVLTLVDTPGAANDAAAERAGVGPAIAELFTAVASARVPVTTLVIGEGGSGGALAFAAPDRIWLTPDSYFSVTSPEAAASILKREPDRVPATAEELTLRPQDMVAAGLARGVVAPGPDDS